MIWIAPTEKNHAADTLEKRLWAAADQLRANSGLTSAQYSQPVLGLIFLRFADARFSARKAALEKAGTSSRRGSRSELTTAEREEVKRVASQLLGRLKTLLTFNWRQTTQTRARVRLAIEEVLDSGLPRPYSPELYQQKCGAVFEHIYEGYCDGQTNIYAN